MDVHGLTRSHPDDRDRVRRRVLALSTAAGVAALGATAVVTLALAPVPTTTVATTVAKTVRAPATLGTTAPQLSSVPAAPPVATSGGS